MCISSLVDFLACFCSLKVHGIHTQAFHFFFFFFAMWKRVIVTIGCVHQLRDQWYRSLKGLKPPTVTITRSRRLGRCLTLLQRGRMHLNWLDKHWCKRWGRSATACCGNIRRTLLAKTNNQIAMRGPHDLSLATKLMPCFILRVDSHMLVGNWEWTRNSRYVYPLPMLLATSIACW